MGIKQFFAIILCFLQISAVGFGGIYSIWALTERALVAHAVPGKGASGRNGAHEGAGDRNGARIRGGGCRESELALSREEFERIFGISQVIPGPQASGLTMLGHGAGGFTAMVAIYIGLLLPGIIIIPLLTRAQAYLSRYQWISHFRRGTSLAIISILVLFAWGLVRHGIAGQNGGRFIFALIAIGACLLSLRLRMNPVLLILLSGAVGYFFL